MNRSREQRAVPSGRYAELSVAQRSLACAFVAAGVAYFAWRATTFNADAWLFSIVVYAAELAGFVMVLLHLATCWKLRQRAPLPAPSTASVAVLVPTRDDPVDLVRRTLLAAHRMRHAHEVWLLDDGNRLEMQVLAEELGCRYLSRLNDWHGKAGCLNYALKQVRAEFVAVFDAGHAPAPSFIEETVGFLADERVAFVQVAQDFYNLDSFRHHAGSGRGRFWSDQTPFFRVVQAGRDAHAAAVLCGSGALVRSAALTDVGGFATESLDPPLHTSLRLHKRGWRSVYYAKPLVFARASTTATPFLDERRRCARGVVQAWHHEGILFARGLSLGQRICYLATLLGGLEAWQRIVVYLAPAVVLMTGVAPVAEFDAGLAAASAAYYLMVLWLLLELGRGYGRPLLGEQYAMTRCAGMIAALFARRETGRRGRKAARAEAGETQAESVTRSWPLYLILVLNMTAVAYALEMHRQGHGLPSVALVAAVLWAAGVGCVALAAIHFGRSRSAWRRREYRFPLPVPLRVRSPKDSVIGLATDISPLGCRVAGVPATAARSGEELVGDLLLPSGPLPVRMVVRTVLVDGHRAAPAGLGCEFLWGVSEERNDLESFLFGSDLQWRLNGFDDRVRTPLEWLADLERGERGPRRRLARQRWAPVLYRRVNSAQEAGIGFVSAACREGDERVLVSLGVLPANGRLYAEEVTAAGPRGIVGRVADEQVLETNAAPIYLYRLIA